MNDLATGSNAPRDQPGSIEARLGREIRKLRGRLGLTGAALAGAAGISNGTLSKIETGQLSPSLSTIEAIAGVLAVPVAALFAAPAAARDASFVPAGQGVAIERRGTKAGHRYQLLGHALDGDVAVEPYLITLTEEAAPYTGFQHAGVELIYMLSGRMTYRHADRLYPMAPGDTLLFDAQAPHGPETLAVLPMTYLSIIIYSRP
jgi:transcriptional regulator with XRE-family HTH domain